MISRCSRFPAFPLFNKSNLIKLQMAATAEPTELKISAESKSPDSPASEAPSTFDPLLAGTWILDKSISDSMDPFLAEVGVPWLIRRGITSFGATLKLALNDDGTVIELKMTTAMRTSENTVAAGKERPWVRGDGTKMTADISITHRGKGYAIQMPQDKKMGTPSMGARLASDDDDMLEDTLKLIPNDPKREPIIINRFFRR